MTFEEMIKNRIRTIFREICHQVFFGFEGTEMYGKDAFSFRENSIVVISPFYRINRVGNKVGKKVGNKNL